MLLLLLLQDAEVSRSGLPLPAPMAVTRCAWKGAQGLSCGRGRCLGRLTLA